jgi:diguanylate cyclase (GGDEF)-like protein
LPVADARIKSPPVLPKVLPRFLPRIAALLCLLVALALASVAITADRIAREIDAKTMLAAEAAVGNALAFIRGKIRLRNDINFDNDMHRGLVVERSPDVIRAHTYVPGGGAADQVHSLLIDSAGAVYHSSLTSTALSADESADMAAAMRPLLDALRERARRFIVDDGSGRLTYAGDPEQPLHAAGLIEADVARVGGRPALVVAAALLPRDPALLSGRDVSVIAHVRPFGPEVYGVLSEAAHLPSLGPADAGPGKASHALRDMAGQPVTMVSHDHMPAGAAIIDAARPIFHLTFALFIGMAMLSTFLLQRLTRRLAHGEAAALHHARHDAMTGLANREWFGVNLSLRQAATRAGRGSFALALIDLDYFKAINDTLGHAAGDAVLVEVAARLRGPDAGAAFAARLGGDEFVALSPEMADEEIADWGNRLRLTLMRPAMIGGTRIDVSTSIGIAVSGAAEGTELMKLADRALYRAKRDGRGCVRLYDVAVDGAEVSVEADIDTLRNAARRFHEGSPALITTARRP